ncbi:hypothetical protein [Streptomyces sp. NPDC047718]|uniref:hypothetical protein n=1 Tax=Streptomyces sp. NPDC047718 TaxID=3155479 RepID=UPI0034096F26
MIINDEESEPDSEKPRDQDEDHPACGICPSKRLPRAAFVLYDRPSWECRFDPADGFRYTADRTPCVHPHKPGVEPNRIAPPKPIAPTAEPEVRARGRWPPPFLVR